VISEGSCE